MQHQQQPPSAPRGSHLGTRRYTIQSKFGNARAPRSRKNRPCDICRRRKTACVITDKPPCLFCKSRGLECLSSPLAPSTAAPGTSPEDSAAGPPGVGDVLSEVITPSPSSTGGQDSGSPAVVHYGLSHHPPLFQPDDTADSNSSLVVPTRDSSIEDQDISRPLHALEDIGDRTSHSMGSAAEQDPHFLSAFRSLLLSEQDEIDANIIQVHDGGQGPESSPVHFLLLMNGFPDHTNKAVKTASDAIEAKVWPHGPALVRLYFKYVHPVYPVVSKARFLRRYSENKLDLPASLRGALYALASVFWKRDPQLPEACPFQQFELVTEAHSALRRELEAPNLFKLQACLLLLHMTPPDIDSVETPSTWFLTSQATACAQMIGLHRDPGPWNISSWEKKLRKKLWWIVYATDCWSAVCHGNPPHIGPSTFDTAPLTVDDLRFDEDVPEDLSHLVDPEDRQFRVAIGARCLEAVNLAQTLRAILDCSYQVKPTISETQAQSCLQTLNDRLREWSSLVPHCLTVGSNRENSHNGPLNLSYYAVQVLLFRALMSPATREAKAMPDSNLSKWFRTALESFTSFAEFMDDITEEDLTGFWGRHARSQLILCGNFLIYLFLLASKPQDIEVAYRLLEKFQHSLQRLGGTDDLSARLLLRPAVLRIESFFLQATELIKKDRQDVVAGSPAQV